MMSLLAHGRLYQLRQASGWLSESPAHARGSFFSRRKVMQLSDLLLLCCNCWQCRCSATECFSRGKGLCTSSREITLKAGSYSLQPSDLCCCRLPTLASVYTRQVQRFKRTWLSKESHHFLQVVKPSCAAHCMNCAVHRHTGTRYCIELRHCQHTPRCCSMLLPDFSSDAADICI